MILPLPHGCRGRLLGLLALEELLDKFVICTEGHLNGAIFNGSNSPFEHLTTEAELTTLDHLLDLLCRTHSVYLCLRRKLTNQQLLVSWNLLQTLDFRESLILEDAPI